MILKIPKWYFCMAQELISDKKTAIIGGGPAGCMCAKILKDAGQDFEIFECNKILKTLLPTGGGKCNLAHAEFDFKELAKNYPRGEKFLYSVFSRFSTSDTLDFFKSIGIETYTREDNRIFPVSDSSADVRSKFLESLGKIKIINEKVVEISKNNNPKWKIKTNKNEYYFDFVVIAIGGHAGINILNKLNINIISQTQALVGLTAEKDFSQISGVKIPDIEIKACGKCFKGDMLFTHKGISGPVIYEMSSVLAREKMPYEISVKLANPADLAEHIQNCNKQEIINALKKYIPKSLAKYLLESLNIDCETKCCEIKSIQRKAIENILSDFRIKIKNKIQDGEVVMSGGVDLNEINPKTMESKTYQGLYFCGEIMDIDGFCGGFNLQNCWSTGYAAACGILSELQ